MKQKKIEEIVEKIIPILEKTPKEILSKAMERMGYFKGTKHKVEYDNPPPRKAFALIERRGKYARLWNMPEGMEIVILDKDK